MEKIEAMIKTKKEFDEIVEKISAIPRTKMGAQDYLTFLRQRGKATHLHRARFLLVHSSDFVFDIFNLNGKLMDVDPIFLFDKKVKNIEFNLNNLYEAYNDDEGMFYNKIIDTSIDAPVITQYIRHAIHSLHALEQEGCSALVRHGYEPYPTRIFTTAVPIKIFESRLHAVK